MKKIFFLLTIVCIAFAGCNSNSNQLTFKAFQLFDDNNEPGPAMDDKGNISFENKVVATISKDGKITLPDEKLVGQFKNDTLEIYGAMTLKSRIDKNGDMYENNVPFLTWNKDGFIQMEGEVSGIRVEPNDPSLYANASVVFLTFFSIQQ